MKKSAPRDIEVARLTSFPAVRDRYESVTTGKIVTIRRSEVSWVRVQEDGHRPFRLSRHSFERNWTKVIEG